MRINPYRCARGSGSVAAATGVFGTVSVYNDSSGPDLIAILAAYNRAISGGDVVLFAAQDKLGTGQVRGTTVVVGQQAIPGLINVQSATVGNAGDFMISGSSQNNGWWLFDFPLCVLQPGWSFAAQTRGSNIAIGFAFLWQAVHPEDLRGQHCPICDVTIAIK